MLLFLSGLLLFPANTCVASVADASFGVAIALVSKLLFGAAIATVHTSLQADTLRVRLEALNAKSCTQRGCFMRATRLAIFVVLGRWSNKHVCKTQHK